MQSDEVSSADNQQERLIQIGWVVGFVDGEGCFSVGVIKQPDRAGRKGYRLGVQVWNEFAVTQGEKSLSILEALKKFFGVGAIYINKRYDNHKEHLYRYTVRRRDDLKSVIIPFFKRYPLRSAKRENFERFVRVFELIDQKRHLTADGLVEILSIAETMNRKTPRKDLMRILNDHTHSAQILL